MHWTPKMSPRSHNIALRAHTISVAFALSAALVVHIIVPVLAWQWTRLPFLGALLGPSLVVSAVEDNWAGAAAGLQTQDRVIAVNQSPISHRQDLTTITMSLSPDEPVVLTLESPNQTNGGWITKNTQVTIDVFPGTDLFVRFVVPYIVGLFYLGIGVWVFYRRYGDGKSQTFAVLCASASIALSTSFDVLTTHTFTHVWSLSLAVTAVALIFLGLSFLPIESVWRQGLVIRLLTLIPAFTVAIWAQVGLYTPDPRAYLLPWLGSWILLAVGVLAFVAALMVARFRPSYVRIRLQAQIVLLGAAFSFAPTVIWLVVSISSRLISSATTSYDFDPLASLTALIVLPVSVSYAVSQTQLPNADGPASDSLYLSARDYRSTVRDFSRELAASLDVGYIVEKLLSYTGTMLQPESAMVFMVSSSDTYDLYRTWGDIDKGALASIRFTPHDRLIAWLQRDPDVEGLLLTPKAVDTLHLEPDERKRIQDLNAVLVVPLRSKEHLLGLLALGTLRSGDRYAAADVMLLSIMTDQAAVAAENALLYTRQVQQEYRMVQQTRRLTDILALGNQLKSLDRDVVVRGTVQAVHERLGFGFVTLSLVDDQDPTRVHIVAWAGIESATWERLATTSLPLIDLEATEGMQKIEHCYFIHAPDTTPELSTSQNAVPWHEGDQLFVPLTTGEELLGYLTVERPESGSRPTEDTIEVLEIFANQAAIAIQNANLYSTIDRALDERVAELATLQEIDTQLNVKLDFDYVMDITLEWAIRITSAVAGTLALVSPDRASLAIVAHKGYSPETDKYWGTPWPIDEGLIGEVVQTGEPAMIEDVAQHIDHIDANLGPRSHLAAPIKREGQVIGTISLESPEPHGFTVDHMSFLMRLADHAAIAIENVRLYEQTNRRVAELIALQQISLDLTSSLNLGAVLDSVAANTFALAQADGITIYLYDEHEDALFFGTGLSKEGKQERPPIPIPDNGLTKGVARQGVATVIPDCAKHPSLLSRWQIGAIASIPLQKAEHVLGVFDIVFNRPRSFSQDELRALYLLADQAAIAIQNAQLFLEVQRANEAKSEFVSIVSHELKVPMTSIQGYARLMTLGAAGQISQQQLDFANTILRNVQRMSHLVNDLLDLSRIESGRIQVSQRPVDLPKIAQDAVRAVEDQIAIRDHTLEISIPDDLPSVNADSARIMQVWINLLSNAFKYTPRGGHIQLSARTHNGREEGPAPAQWVLCAVEDNGVGIEPKDQERIFEQFYRVHHPETSGESGTGLGLSITRSIIELHGGHIWVESELGRGSVFYFTLPIA